MQNNKQFDVGRNDKFYNLTIPSYYHISESVFYEIHLKDLVHGSTYMCSFRFNDFKLVYENLTKLKIELPQFPKTHIWKKTNKNPKMIEQRRATLENFFNLVVNDPFTRGYKEIKNFIRNCKAGEGVRRTYSLKKKQRVVEESRPKSLSKSTASSKNINFKPIRK